MKVIISQTVFLTEKIFQVIGKKGMIQQLFHEWEML